MSNSPSPRVAARIADSRRRILEAARIVVAEQGCAAAQVAVVAKVAGVATGSVYRHFPSKVSLFTEMLRAVCQRELDVVKAIAAEPGRSCADRIHDAVATFADRTLRGGGLAHAVVVEPMDPEIDQVRLEARAGLAAAFSALIVEGIDRGEFGEQNSGICGAAIVGALLEGVVAPLANRDTSEIDREAIAAEIAGFCIAAVARPPARSVASVNARRLAQPSTTALQEEGTS